MIGQEKKRRRRRGRNERRRRRIGRRKSCAQVLSFRQMKEGRRKRTVKEEGEKKDGVDMEHAALSLFVPVFFLAARSLYYTACQHMSNAQHDPRQSMLHSTLPLQSTLHCT